MNNLFMVFPSSPIVGGGNPPVIHVIAQLLRVLLEKVGEVVMHSSLEEWWGICKPKIHDARNIGAKGGFESSLMLIFFCNSDIVISPMYIKLGDTVGILGC